MEEFIASPREGWMMLPNGDHAFIEPISFPALLALAELGEEGVGKTAKHEIAHAYVAFSNGTGIKLVSIVPGPGYAGITVLKSADMYAAAASTAGGHSGDGHDKAIVESSGIDLSHATSVASRIMSGKKFEMLLMAALLQKRKTIHESDLSETAKAVREGPLFLVRIISADGKKSARTIKGAFADDKGNIKIPMENQTKSEPKISSRATERR
jgi:hypothetical protein